MPIDYSTWFGYAYYEYDEETGLPLDLRLVVKPGMYDFFTGKTSHRPRPIHLAYRSLFIVNLKTGKIVKDRHGRPGKKATPFELALFTNIKEREERLQGAGI